MATNSIKTAKIERRKLWFESIDDLLVELDRIERAAENGTLNVNGNWTAGQILAHISNWIEYGWTGYPVKSPPFFLKWITVRMGHRFIRKGMPAGQKIPGTKEGTFGQEKIETAEGLRRLRKNLERLQNGEVAKFDSPAFGPLSHEDRIQLNLRHAELHLSFLNY